MRCRIISFFIIIGFICWITDFVIKVFNGNITTRYAVSTLIVSMITVLHIVEDRLHARGKIKSNLLYFLIAACYPVFIFVYFHLLWLNLFFKACLEDSNALGAFLFVVGTMRRRTRTGTRPFQLCCSPISALLGANYSQIAWRNGWDWSAIWLRLRDVSVGRPTEGRQSA